MLEMYYFSLIEYKLSVKSYYLKTIVSVTSLHYIANNIKIHPFNLHRSLKINKLL